jgi:ferredoxin, 2Fe-2S
MTKVIFIDHDGNNYQINANQGDSLMEAAISNNVPGIDADCGGLCACGTCHVFVELNWLSKVGERSEMEDSMLEYTENVKSNSRLSCQITISEELEGLTIKLPEEQF